MDPNVKLLVEEVVKQLHAEIKEGFVVHKATFAKCLDAVTAVEHIHDARLANLEEAAASSDKVLAEWRPEVDASVKLELNSFFAREAKAPTASQQGLLTIRSAPTTSLAVATGPSGYRVAPSHRDCEFGRVFTQIHNPIKGMVQTSSPPPNFAPPPHLELARGVQSLPVPNLLGHEPRVPLGKLPKMNFPKFENKNSKL
jgi:hypothetical protein